MKTAVLLLFLVSAGVYAKQELTPKGKACAKEIGVDEETVRQKMDLDNLVIPDEEDEIREKFLGCVLKDIISDDNEVVEEDKLVAYIALIAKKRLHKEKLSKLVAKECVSKCKGLKGETKGKTAATVMRCIIKNLREYVLEE